MLKLKNSRPRLGQHFLDDERILNKIVDAAQVRRSDVVVEIGPGTGSLTQKLAMRARKVLAWELDRGLALALRKRLAHFRNLEIINADILQFFEIAAGLARAEKLLREYKVIGNIPYYITGKILRLFTENKKRPQVMVLTVQEEVAERVCAKPGKMSILAVAVQTFGQPEIIDYISREKFSPPPEVDSAILKIEMRARSQLAQGLGWYGRRGRPTVTAQEMETQEGEYFRLVKIGFSSPRKQIHNNLRNGYQLEQKEVDAWLARAEIRRTRRPQELAPEDWVRLLENK